MKWYGLTGSIGTGKSTVSHFLRDLGVPVIDADQVSHQMTQTGTPQYQQIVDLFGPQILKPDGSIDRQKLGKQVFEDKLLLGKLESILHPAIQIEVSSQRKNLEKKGYKFAVYDVPLLFEKKLEKNFDGIISVLSNEKFQIERIKKRNPQLSESEILTRMGHQIGTAYKRENSDFVLENEGSLEDLKKLVIELKAQLESIS